MVDKTPSETSSGVKKSGNPSIKKGPQSLRKQQSLLSFFTPKTGAAAAIATTPSADAFSSDPIGPSSPIRQQDAGSHSNGMENGENDVTREGQVLTTSPMCLKARDLQQRYLRAQLPDL